MENVEVTMEGKIAVVRIDTSKRLRLSETKKTTIVGSTGGFQTLGDTGVKLNVTAIAKA